VTGADHFLYDDPAFFARYREMRERGAGLNEDLERPAITRRLPDVADADVLDIGCGDGTLGRWLASRAARRILCTDPSARMLTLAARHPQPRVQYCRACAQTHAHPPGRGTTRT
jgi:2-polyprenyl-3-methyl-5-hydroxy-6-metoxy-1,4-benzoquinol methylase